MKKLDKLIIFNNPHRLNDSARVEDSVSVIEIVKIEQNEIVNDIDEIKVSEPRIVSPKISIL